MCSSSSSPLSTDNELPPSHTNNRRLAHFFFACFQNALIGGIVFGWASIDRTLLAASRDQGGAELTPSQTTQLFTYASSAAMLSSLLLGPLLDARGPRTCLATAHFLVVLGCAGFSAATQFWHYAAAVIGIAFGGPGIVISIMHVANLFPQNQFLAMSCLSGSITLSFSVLAILNVIWETYQVGFRTLFGAYSLIAAVSMMGTLFLSPDEPYEMEEEEEEEDETDCHPSLEQEYVDATLYTYAHPHQHSFLLTDQSLNSTLRRDGLNDDDEDYHCQSDRSHGPHLHLEKHHSFVESKRALQSGNAAVVKLMSLKDQPFAVQLQSPTFARAVVIFIATSFLANFTIASLTTELEDLAQFDVNQQHDLSQQFTWLLSLGMLYTVPVGWLMDRLGLEVCTLLTLYLGQLSSILMMASLGSHVIMVLGFALYSLFRQFLFPVFLAYITARFGFKYFGILTGIGFALSGLMQCFMAKLVEWVHNDNYLGWMEFHILQVVLLAGLMLIPIADHRDMQRRQVEMEQALRRGPGSSCQSPRSVARKTATSSTPIGKEHNGADVEYGSLLTN